MKKRYISIILIIILTAILTLTAERIARMKLKFISQFMPQNEAKIFLKWVKYYDNDWLIPLTVMAVETEFVNDVTGAAGEKMKYQIMLRTRNNCRQVLKHIIPNTSIHNKEFEHAAGNMTIRYFQRAGFRWEKQVYEWVDDYSLVGILMYNTGVAGYKSGRRNKAYIKKWLMLYEHYQCEYRAYKRNVMNWIRL